MNGYEDNTKEYIMEVECEFVDWINLVQDGGPITGSPLGLNTPLFLSVLNIF